MFSVRFTLLHISFFGLVKASVAGRVIQATGEISLDTPGVTAIPARHSERELKLSLFLSPTL